MENESREEERKASLISSFCEITSSPRAEAEFFLESHGWDLDAAVSTFLDDDVVENPNHSVRTNEGTGGVGGVLDSPSQSPGYAPSDSSPSEPSPPRSRSPTPPASRDPYRLRSRPIAEKQSEKPSGSRQTGASGSNIRSFADLNRSPPSGAESDSDEGQEYYTGGQKSGMLVQDPRKVKDVDAIFDQARHSAVERPAELSRPSARSFTGTGRLLSGETVPASSQQPQPPQDVSHTITFWRNGFTVDDGPLRRLDDPANASFLESISNSECPKELEPTDRMVRVHVDLIRREENFEQKPPKPGQRAAFLGVGRTLGSTSTPAAASDAPPPVTTSPSPSMGLVVDPSLPTTSIQLRLADGTRLVSRFNHHHTIRDIRGFIDASRPCGRKDYQLLTMGFPPKQLADLDQTIEQAGISNSVVIQKF